MTRLITTSTANSVSIPVEKMGPPGVVTHLHVVPVFESETRADEKRLRDTTPRNFQITARFAKNNDVQSNINFNFEEDSGDSLFSFPEGAAYMKVGTDDGQFVFCPNSDRRFSTVRFDCTAQTAVDARRLFHKIVGPALDHMAYVANTPLSLCTS